MSPLQHVRRGAGPRTTLLLHGFLGSGRNLGSLARRWSELDPARSLVLVDLRGHGTSPPLPPLPTLDILAQDIVDLARQTGAREILGHSLGGRVALRARALASGAIATVTLLDISPAPTADLASGLRTVLGAFLAAPASAPSRDDMAAHLRTGIPESLVQWLLLNLDRRANGEVVWRVDRQGLAALHHQSEQVDLWETLSHGPTRCIRGANSTFVDDRAAQRMLDAGCPVDTVAGAGHFVHVENLAELLRLLTA